MRPGLLAALSLLLPALASATDVQGTLSSHTHWKKSGSPYVLKGDVTVAWGVKLTIEPGVRVIASSTDALHSGVDPQRVELIVDGTLLVQGTVANPVEFTSDEGSWYGIRVRGGRGTVIDGAVITQAHQGIWLGMSAVVRNTSVSATVEDCLQVSWGEATLEHNRLDGCGQQRAVAARQAPPPSSAEAEGPGRRAAKMTSPEPRGGMVAADSAPETPAAPIARRAPSGRPGSAPRVETSPHSLPQAGTGGSAASLGGGCAREPQVGEPPECPGIRRWRQKQERLGEAEPDSRRPRTPAPDPPPHVHPRLPERAALPGPALAGNARFSSFTWFTPTGPPTSGLREPAFVGPRPYT